MPTRKRISPPKSIARATPRKSISVVKKLPRKKKKKLAANSDGQNVVLALRQSLGLTRNVFSRLSQSSERAIADWESGKELGGTSRQRMTQLLRLQRALSGVMEPSYIGEWLQSPNDSFNGLKPLEVIERGEIDRIWQMIHLLESGVPT